MKKLEEFMIECIAELQALGIRPSKKIFSVRENRRAKKRLGCCRTVVINGERGYVLEISSLLAEKDDRVIKEVMFHELLHTCKGCMNHGKKWKSYADRVNRAYGYNICTTADYGRYNLELPTGNTYRYEIRCRACGKAFYRVRRGKVVQHPENYRCSACGGMLDVRPLEPERDL